MKSIRKCISVLLALVLCFACAAPAGVSAEDAPAPGDYPESAHPYADNMNQTWTYTYPEDVDQLFVTFSSSSEVEQGFYDEKTDKWKTGDQLNIRSENLEYGLSLSWCFDGTPYTACVPGRSFILEMYTDDSVTGYGFSIDRISPQPPADYYAVRCAYAEESVIGFWPANTDGTENEMYLPGFGDFDRMETQNGLLIGWEAPSGNKYYYSDDESPLLETVDLVAGEIVDLTPIFCPFDQIITLCINYNGDTVTTSNPPNRLLQAPGDYYGTITEDGAIIGWKNDAGVELRYINSWLSEFSGEQPDPGETLTFTTPICCPLSIRPEETFSFSNENGKDDYFMTSSQKWQLLKNYIAATVLTPFAPIGALLGLITATIYPRWPENGVCCAFPQLILMQHAGKIDLPSIQGVKNMDELKLRDENGEVDDELSGILSYYNAASHAGLVCSNMAIEPGTKEYQTQSQALYETVASGKPTVIFYYPTSDTHPFSAERTKQNLHYLKNRDLSGLILNVVEMHSVLLTGAYTTADGQHIFFGYDSNGNSKRWGEGYVSGKAEYYRMSEDFSYFEFGPYNWTADPDVFTPFRLDQPTNPILYAKNFFRSLIGLITKKPF